MLGFFSSKVKIEVGCRVEVQHPVSNNWLSGSVTKNEGDGYYTVACDEGEELTHVQAKKIRNVSSADKSSKIDRSSKRPGPSSFSLFGGSRKHEVEVQPIVENQVSSMRSSMPSVEPIVEEEKPVRLARKSSIKLMVEPPVEIFEKKIQRRAIDNEEMVWLERTRKCNQGGRRCLDLTKLDLEDDVPTIFHDFSDIGEVLCRKNLFRSLEPLRIFQNLTFLDVSFNLLGEAKGEDRQNVFNGLIQLRGLQSLDLSGNHLESIPTEVFQLKLLTSLIMRRNDIRDVPPQLAKCSALGVVDLSFNHIATIPSVFEDMDKLRDLNLDHNPCIEDSSLQESKAGERTIFLLEKRQIHRNHQYRRSVVQHATDIQHSVIDREKNRIVTQLAERNRLVVEELNR